MTGLRLECVPAPAAWETLMFAIIGIVVVIGAIVGGYLMEHGNLKVLIQPAELIIIGGAADVFPTGMKNHPVHPPEEKQSDEKPSPAKPISENH